ncbi:MAG: hypothetical protein PHP93_02235 [Kiritimatiellales bacterium]|nr:hypothetical protein [Kiritimatiellales bacterium]
MKKCLILILCAVFGAVFAQQPGEGRPQRIRPADSGAKKDGAAENPAEKRVDETAVISSENQESFDNIMGSFSDLAMKFSEKDASNLDIFVYECRYISGKAFSRALEPFLSVNGELSDCMDSDRVVISDERDRIAKLKEIAAAIDRPVRQVLVSASVVEFQITDGFEKDLSLQYNQFVNMADLPGAFPASGVDKSLSSAFASRIMNAIVPTGSNPASLGGTSSYMYYDPDEQAIFSAFLTFLQKNGTAQILSSPSLILRRGHTGNILSGEDIPVTKSNVGSGGTSYSVDYKSVGIKLRVTPESIFDTRVVLEVSPEVSNIIRYEESSAGRNPVVAIRNANTLLEMNDGYMVSIGGLLREEQLKSERRIPILGSIPLLGSLFRASSSSTIRSQLVIFLSVKIVNPDDLAIDTIDAKGIPQELQQQIDASRAAFPVKKPSFFGGFKKWFQ